MYGNKLKEIRKELSATQEQMAEHLKITYRSYTSYERNENNPPYSMLVILCKKYKVNLNWFIANEGKMFITETYFLNNDLKDFIHQEVFSILRTKGIVI